MKIEQEHCTELVAKQVADDLSEYAEQEGTCCFCLRELPGQATAEAINHNYFTDYGFMQRDTGHACKHCAFCIQSKDVRNGHWFANDNRFVSVASGDLLSFLQEVANDEYDSPFALHVSENPIRSEHAYLWTPVAYTTAGFPVSYGKATVTVEWQTFEQVVDAIEELRYYGFRLDDIRADEPTVNSLQKIGPDRYRELSNFLRGYRGSSLFELAVTVSRGKSDQTDKSYLED